MKPQASSERSDAGRVRLAAPLSDLADLTGRTAVVTGGGGGLGLATARGLARRGADVLLGVRDTERGERVRRHLIEEHRLRDAQVTVAHLDLLDLDSVRRFAAEVRRPLDLLVLNAGISSVPLRLSPQGVESQFATNHLGHFALTGHLLTALEEGTDPRVVTVSSALYKGAVLDVDDLAGAHGHSPGRSYGRSKLANTLFALELERRLRATDSPIRSFAAHPGLARTPMHTTYPSHMTRLATRAIAAVIGRDPEPAAAPVLAAAASHRVHPGLFWGPVGSRSHPDVLGVAFVPPATDTSAAARLWTTSTRLTGVHPLD
ncbi:SDR family NAD(P)-dependent oxidoreductase [Nocardiopsis sp. MG754419]|uniref:SDR family NAD(P)-dependent oxidoreductase n=1 Tax=Nocardiopsis sp. MG754419 TaxID=2259865 RepID=UPI001BAB2384|nr:SDR family NAD(P)-dependent oxidoreductase [Nocardiopsis sp. MG754419]